MERAEGNGSCPTRCGAPHRKMTLMDTRIRWRLAAYLALTTIVTLGVFAILWPR
jgi:hypothetical protein